MHIVNQLVISVFELVNLFFITASCAGRTLTDPLTIFILNSNIYMCRVPRSVSLSTEQRWTSRATGRSHWAMLENVQNVHVQWWWWSTVGAITAHTFTHANANAAQWGEAEFPSLSLQMFGMPTRLQVTDESFVSQEVGVWRCARWNAAFVLKHGSFGGFSHLNWLGRFQFSNVAQTQQPLRNSRFILKHFI